jgi:hypothetical protein
MRSLASFIWRVATCVPLGGRNPRVAQDLLDDADVHSLLDQERGGRVPGVVDASITDLGGA